MSVDASYGGGRLRAIGVSLAVAVLGFVLGTVVALALAVALVVGFGVELTGPVQLFLSLVSLQGIAFPVTAVLYLRWRGLSWSFIPASVPSLREWGVVVGSYVGTLLLVNVLGAVLVSVFGDPASNQASEIALDNPEIIPFLIPLVFLFNGPGEELLFRGAIQGTLREHFGPAPAIVLASLMFAPAHITALVGSLRAAMVTMTILLVPGLVFGAVYEYTDNIVVPSLVHGLYNATLFAAIYAVATSEGSTAAFVVLP